MEFSIWFIFVFSFCLFPFSLFSKKNSKLSFTFYDFYQSLVGCILFYTGIFSFVLVSLFSLRFLI